MTKTCIVCGVAFVPKGHSGLKIACSRKCGARYRHGPKLAPHELDGVGHLPLQKDRWTLVDASDLARCSAHNWVTNGKGIVHALVDGKHVKLHRFLLGDQAGPLVDHKDGDPLNNRRSNLRRATPRENRRNSRKMSKTTSSAYKGVCWQESGGAWQAQIRKKDPGSPERGIGRMTYLGYFADELDAADAYDAAARAHYGEFACLNNARAGERSAVA